MSKIKVSVAFDGMRLQVLFNGLPHLYIPDMGDFAGLQAFHNSDSYFAIEYSFNDGGKIVCEYMSRALWSDILGKLHRALENDAH